MSLFKPISLIEVRHGKSFVSRARELKMIQTEHASVSIRERYKDTGRMLGEGTFGQVFLFEERAKPGVNVAIKIMRKDLLTDEQMQVIRDEISILAMLEHRHIIKHVESYEDPRYMYIVMEAMKHSKSL